ncbi:MAG: hypothetical protein AB7O26_18465 [Planctomycetaceae bacterium]
MTQFVNNAAELFEPIDDVGRVGFDCQVADDCWEVALYLGSTEIVGGKEDGQFRFSGFDFDLRALIGQFHEVENIQLATSDDGGDDSPSVLRSNVMIEGRIDDNRIRVRVHSIPPGDVGPGLRRHVDGRCDPV